MSKVFTFKTVSGDTILGEFYGVDEKRGILHISVPVKIMLIPTHTPEGLFTQFIPSLYQPFGTTNVVPIKQEFVVSILPCSDFDTRYYYETLKMLMYTETKRMIATDKAMYLNEYADKFIMKTHDTIQ